MDSAIWAYPWDLLDEGVDDAAARIADSGLGAISVASLYHAVRALCPHNPLHAVVHGEGGVVAFRHDPDYFVDTPIKPVTSVLAADSDPLHEIGDAAHRHGLALHAWITPHHNSRLGATYPEATIVDAFGDRFPFGLCPANPAVRAYTSGIVRSLADHGAVDVIEIESLGYMGMEHSGHHAKQGVTLDAARRYLLSVCYCPHCTAAMETHGVDVGRARASTMEDFRSYVDGHTGGDCGEPIDTIAGILGRRQVDGILAARDEVVLTLLEDLYWHVHDRQKLSLMVSGDPLATGAQCGVTLSQARTWTDRLLTQAFCRSASEVHDLVADVAVRRGHTPLHVGLQALAPFVRSGVDLAEQTVAARDAGAEGLQFYHYGLMPLANLAWIRDALAA